ncbi:MAG: MFS transporter [Dehalococcoidia bacterium]|jgi:MFS family permease|nr:MFS transporter [Dehalococcoidia bacterium]MDP7239582.1 MFS transporter [Dehalococcoidia bacterium]
MSQDTESLDHNDGTIAALARRRGLVLLAATLGMFLVFLDSAVNVALPAISQGLDSSIQGILWIIIIYQLVRVALLPTLGNVGDSLGLRPVFITGLLLYTLGVAVVGLSGSIPQMAALRGFQAVGTAMLWAAAPALVGRAFPIGERGRALGVMTAGGSAGLIGGPLLGGLVLEWWGWPAIFWFRVPIGIMLIAVALIAVRGGTRSHPEPSRHYDIAGAAILAGGLGLLTIALSLLGQGVGYALPLFMIIGGLGLLGSFVAVEARSSSPLIPVSILRHQTFMVAVARGYLGHTAIFIVWFLFPFFMEERLLLPAAMMGVTLTVPPFVATVVSPLSGWASDRVGTWWPVNIGLLVATAAVWLLGGFQGGDAILPVIAALALMGLGFGLYQAPNYSSLMNSVPPEKMATATSMLGMSTTLGTITAVALSSAVFSLRRGAYEALPSGTAFDLAFRDTVFLFAVIGALGLAVSLSGTRQEWRRRHR